MMEREGAAKNSACAKGSAKGSACDWRAAQSSACPQSQQRRQWFFPLCICGVLVCIHVFKKVAGPLKIQKCHHLCIHVLTDFGPNEYCDWCKSWCATD
eukprot:scaffold26101_cov20-Tisochrysis_lutea.AAC.2